MRTFIAVEFPEEIKREIRKIQDKLPEFSGKKTEGENLHLTLKFLGETNEKKIEEIKKALASLNFNKFEAGLGKIGYFSPKFIRILWIDLIDEKGEIDRLKEEIEKVLADLFQKDKRKFSKHVTIARVRSIKDKEKFAEELRKIKVNDMKFEVDKISFKKSTLTEKGPVYESLMEVKLQ